MIKIIEGNILDAPEDIICQQVNCQGVMGSGLALQIIKKYPEVYPKYKEFCKNYHWGLPGSTCFIKVKDHVIANLFGQYDYGRSKKVYTNYIYLESSMVLTDTYAKMNNFSVAIPYEIGCGLANGDWKIVREMIDRVFGNYDNVAIYKLTT
jgi:O-acetyl-ADP-ribose deacetylase (regulator of RNase III)